MASHMNTIGFSKYHDLKNFLILLIINQSDKQKYLEISTQLWMSLSSLVDIVFIIVNLEMNLDLLKISSRENFL